MIFKVLKEDRYKTGVYCITNLLNNKYYIGSTSNNFYNRYHQHVSDYKAGKRDIRVLYRAFDKYGIENFEFSIICICSKENCIKMEQFYIDKGTDYNCAMVAGSLLGLKHLPTSKTRTIVGGLHHCAISVDKYTLDGIFIKSYNSVIEAKNDNNIKSSSNIMQCCKGNVFSAGGFRWAYKNKKLIDRLNRLGKCRVALYKDGFYKEFNSQTECAKYLKETHKTKCNQGLVHRALKLKIKIYKFNIKKL